MRPKAKTKKELKALGFKPITQHPEIWVNEKGNVYSYAKLAFLKPNSRNLIALDQGGYLHIAKAILQEFAGQKIRERASLIYIDGCKTNLSPQNLKYKRLFYGSPENINQANLTNAIRCYFAIERGFNALGLLARIYLEQIYHKTPQFEFANCNKEGYSVFHYHITNPETSILKTAKTQSIAIRDCYYIVNKYTNEFADFILAQLESGQLNQYPYFSAKRKRNKQNALASWNKHTRSIQKSKKAAK
jgi:hypothetical protein